MSGKSQVIVARIGAAHGIKGEVRLASYTADPMDVAKYGALHATDEREFTIVRVRPAGGSPNVLIVGFKGVTDRTAAEALNGTELSVPRDALAAPAEDEFYHSDLIGLSAVSTTGAPLGTVIAVQNYGAGDLIEIAPARGNTILVPFTRAAVPEINVPGGRVVIDPPPGLIGEDDARPQRLVELTPYDPKWAELAAEDARQLQAQLAPVVLAVHHVGSTAVPGLAAKPVVDLVGVVTSLDALDRRRADVERLGFEWRGEHGFPGRRYCIKCDPATGRRLVHVHCYAEGDPAIERYLALRDYLRAQPEQAAAYEREKRRCQASHAHDPAAYQSCKGEWIAAAEDRAMAFRHGRETP